MNLLGGSEAVIKRKMKADFSERTARHKSSNPSFGH